MNQQRNQSDNRTTTQAVARLAPSRMPINPAIAKEFDVTPADWRVLVDQIFPAAKTVEAVVMALSYCRSRNLDIFKKPVHIVPMWSSALGRMVETVWPGIAEIRTTASRTGEYGGIDAVEFGPMKKQTFKGTTGGSRPEQIEKKVEFPEWASVVVYRFVKGHKVAFHAKVYWEETYASVGKTDVPNDMWAKRPRGQLDKCVEAAALRKAFPEELGGIFAAEEMEGRTIEGVATDVQTAGAPARVEPPTPPSPPAPPVEDATDIEAFDAQEFAEDIIAGVAKSETEESLIEYWESEKVDDLLADHEDLLNDVYAAREKRLAIFEGGEEPEGSAQDGADFPGDTP